MSFRGFPQEMRPLAHFFTPNLWFQEAFFSQFEVERIQDVSLWVYENKARRAVSWRRRRRGALVRSITCVSDVEEASILANAA